MPFQGASLCKSHMFFLNCYLPSLGALLQQQNQAGGNLESTEGIKLNDNHVITQAADHLGNAFFSNPQLCGEKWDLVVGS